MTEGDNVITQDNTLADTFNAFFADMVNNLDIKDFNTGYTQNEKLDDLENIIEKFK